MKICVFANDFSYQTGVERVASVIINALVAQGHEIDILSLSRGQKAAYELDDSVRLYQLFEDKVSRSGVLPLSARRSLRFASALLKIRRFFEKNKYDMIIDTEYMLGFMAATALKGKRICKVHWEHVNFNIDPPDSRKRKIRQKLAGMVDGIVALTDRDQQYWRQGADIKGRITTINNPIPFDIPDVQYNHGSRVVLNVGRFDSQKGYDLLLKAWAKLPTAVMKEGWTLRIVGNGKTRPAMKTLCKTLNIEDSVEMLPATSDVVSHYKSAAFFCMSSRFEGFPMVLLEAQAHGLPCVSFDCDTGPAEMIEHGQNGLLAEDRDVDALARALQQAMASREARIAMSARARQSVTRFKLAPIAEQWGQFLDELERSSNHKEKLSGETERPSIQ